MSTTPSSSVQVAIRVRPLLALETGSTQCVEVLKQNYSQNSSPKYPNTVRIGGAKGPAFCFDRAFGGSTSQQELYDERIRPLVTSCLEGYNATTFAYGQTGSGKTFTMTGPTTSMQDDGHAGVIPRAIQSLFDQLEEWKERRTDENSKYEYEVRIQYLELYGEDIRDLLSVSSNKSNSKLTIRDIGLDEPEVLGATQHKVDCADEALVCLARGMLRRVTGPTAMNATSSRSHSILSVMVEQSSTSSNKDGHISVLRSKFNFVDLAGSERQKRTKAEGKRLKEGIDINKGLLVLGNVISALGDPNKVGKTFVPYRDSKLTRLLKGSLGGNHKTLMIACVSPSSSNLDESLNCLRYANRAKNIQNNATVNVDANTKLLAELRGCIATLASEVLRIKKYGDEKNQENGLPVKVDNKFTVDLLQELIKGNPAGTSRSNDDREGVENPLSTPNSVSTPLSTNVRESFFPQSPTSEELIFAESRAEQLKTALQTTTKELQRMTEKIFKLKAEKEMYRLRSNHIESPNNLEAAFMEKATSYEREIATLKAAFQASAVLSPNSQDREKQEERSASLLEVASNSLKQERAELEQLRTKLDDTQTPSRRVNQEPVSTPLSRDGSLDSREMNALRSQVLLSMSPSTQLDAEDAAADEEMLAIKSEFLKDEEESERVLNDTSFHDEPINDINEAKGHQQMQFNLMKLSKTIDDKEALIEELQSAQKKYASMRCFYEEKLKQMENQVREREEEREALVLEVETSRQNAGPRTKELEEKLSMKERHIAGLKKRQSELVKLTKVSGKNEEEINRLKNDLITMKQRKVEMQKLVNNERKAHIGEVNRLKKEVMQRDREVTKLKRISSKQTQQAEKAKLVAKSRLEQIGILKAKYTESERKLRISTVKRGVMEKAGLDSVIVGRRNIGSKKQVTKKNSELRSSSIDIDAIRDFLDEKVSNVGKKEQIADKLANEWEDHLELVSTKQKLLEDGASQESIESIDVQLSYKEERIRGLAQRLGRQADDGGAGKETPSSGFDESEFKRLLPEASTVSGAKLTSRVLFGMVVRERRRVASLARTAASLNEKFKIAEKEMSEKEAAFRSYKEDELSERSSMAQSHQQQILSLMAMVKEEEEVLDATPVSYSEHLAASSPGVRSKTKIPLPSSSMTILTNERIEVLECQLREEREKSEAMKVYKIMEADAQKDREAKAQECERLREVTEKLRVSLCQIRDIIIQKESKEQEVDSPSRESSKVDSSIVGILEKALKPGDTSVKSSFSSDEDDEEEVPEWADDIMADLAIIAEGNVPKTLLDSPNFKDVLDEKRDDRNESKSKNDGSVFDRLTNPNNFTGVQKQKARKTKEKRSSKTLPSSEMSQENRRAMARNAVKKLDSFFANPEQSDQTPLTDRNNKVEVPGSRSVFDRLLSPSMYTGTQKEKLLSKKFQEEDAHGDISEKPNTTEIPVDVFERLQNTTTKSYAVKQVHDIKQPSPQRLRKIKESGSPRMSPVEDNDVSPPSIERSLYTQQNVFERLQNTTTRAYAEKQMCRHQDEPGRSTRLAESSSNTDPGGVFERLQKTTTHSFASKHIPSDYDELL
mmetsp:Transcript_15110/g.22260  ORF Transcript_15110/g.22260 Transcript_15110/m.22260 type:complete len:1577 (-) Transcript_15110:1105-5835(-)